MKTATELVRFDAAPNDPWNPTATPIYQTATFEQPSATEWGPYDYSRSGNPTRRVLEDQLAKLDRAARGFAFASGMAAISNVLGLVPAGSEIIAGDDLYGGTFRWLAKIAPTRGLSVRYVDATDVNAIESAVTPKTGLVLVESPTNPLLKIVDLVAVAKIAHVAGALFAVDNSAMTPLLQKPLELGADIAIYSATKYLNGHGDVSAGALTVKSNELADRIAFLQNAEGNALGPFDAFLFLRGLKTLALRLERQQKSALEVVAFLESHPRVRRVFFPTSATATGREVHSTQALGAGGILSFETDSPESAKQVVNSTQLFTISVSFGNISSSISLPAKMSHASIPAEERLRRGITDNLVRLSVGIEDPGDLIEDLARALAPAQMSNDSTGAKEPAERAVVLTK